VAVDSSLAVTVVSTASSSKKNLEKLGNGKQQLSATASHGGLGGHAWARRPSNSAGPASVTPTLIAPAREYCKIGATRMPRNAGVSRLAATDSDRDRAPGFCQHWQIDGTGRPRAILFISAQDPRDVRVPRAG
jgi:hypothetical protein